MYMMNRFIKRINPSKNFIPIRSNLESYEPFFIVGSGRSGNTLLRRILNANKGIHIPPETYVLEKIIRDFKKNRSLNWRNIVYLALAEFEFHPEFETFKISLRDLAQELLNISPQKRNLAYILNSFYIYHASSCQKTSVRWGDKTPYNTFFLNDIFEVFPKGKFIHIIRDGCDVVSSYVEAGLYKDFTAAACRWNDSLVAVEKFKQRNSDICLEIRYESLVKTPENTIEKICEFLNLEYFSEMIEMNENIWEMGDVTMRSHHKNVLTPISTSGIGKGRKKLSNEARNEIRNIINPQLIKYGYSPC